MRTFIAIPLPAEIRHTLLSLQRELGQTGADVKWVEPENIHLTLKFLGELNEKKVPPVCQALEETARAKSAFGARLGPVGAFPATSSPRTIWVGLGKGEEETAEIARALEERIARIGIPKEKREFTPHITIGRTRSAKNIGKLKEALASCRERFGNEGYEFSVDRVILFKSTLTPKGPIYENIKEGALSPPEA